WDWAAPRIRRWPELDAELRERIDGGTRLRRKLTTWCDMAQRNVTRALDAIEMKHAVEGVIALFEKLREFERRAPAGSGLRPAAPASGPPAGDVALLDPAD